MHPKKIDINHIQERELARLEEWRSELRMVLRAMNFRIHHLKSQVKQRKRPRAKAPPKPKLIPYVGAPR